MTAPLVLAVNPGAGSTKLALFRALRQAQGERVERVREARLEHPGLASQPAARTWDELPARLEAAQGFLMAAGVKRGDLAAVAGRGGLLPPLAAGAYAVSDAMLRDLEAAERGQHASNLGAPMARALAGPHGCPALIVDPVSVDELEPVARVTGLADVERRSYSHALNMRAVAQRHARAAGRPYASLRLVVAHLGTGISLSAHREGRMVDVANPLDEGPFSGDRAGGVPVMAVVEACFAPGATAAGVKRRLFGDGGLYSHLGTRDAREALARAEAGDDRARRVLEAMLYQVAKSAGALAAALEGRVDALLLTGGLCHLPFVVDRLRASLAWIAPVEIHPGEDELLALAEGALRVLRGEEPARTYAP